MNPYEAHPGVWLIFGWKTGSEKTEVMRVCETKEKAEKAIEEFQSSTNSLHLKGFNFIANKYPVW